MNAPTNCPSAREASRKPLAELRIPSLRVCSQCSMRRDVAFKLSVEDIKERGQQEPIRLYQGKVLDGRNRATACEWLGRRS